MLTIIVVSVCTPSSNTDGCFSLYKLLFSFFSITSVTKTGTQFAQLSFICMIFLNELALPRNDNKANGTRRNLPPNAATSGSQNSKQNESNKGKGKNKNKSEKVKESNY